MKVKDSGAGGRLLIMQRFKVTHIKGFEIIMICPLVEAVSASDKLPLLRKGAAGPAPSSRNAQAPSKTRLVTEPARQLLGHLPVLQLCWTEVDVGTPGLRVYSQLPNHQLPQQGKWPPLN